MTLKIVVSLTLILTLTFLLLGLTFPQIDSYSRSHFPEYATLVSLTLKVILFVLVFPIYELIINKLNNNSQNG